jgi:WD40 repeat protein
VVASTGSPSAAGGAGGGGGTVDNNDDIDSGAEGGESEADGGRAAHADAVSAIPTFEELLLTDDPALLALQRPRTFTAHADGGAAATFEVSCDALLSGHDGWVTSVRWHPPVPVRGTDGNRGMWQPPCVVTASMDKSSILWQPAGAAAVQTRGAAAGGAASEMPHGGGGGGGAGDALLWDGVWESVVRVGGAGGNALGLFGAALSPDGGTLVAHGYQGALHAWHCAGKPAGRSADGVASPPTVSAFTVGGLDAAVRWAAGPAPGGHFGAVEDVCWGTRGQYLLTASRDSSTRVWGPVAPPSAPSPAAGQSATAAVDNCADYTWHEVGRPQIHGYELAALAMPCMPGVPHRLYSAADEKVLRVFDAPRQFVATLQRVCGRALASSGTGAFEASAAGLPSAAAAAAAAAAATADICAVDAVDRAEFAYLPELGLTNKAVSSAGVGAPIRDRYQLDGKDASQRGYDSVAAAMQSATQAALEGGGAAVSSDGGGDAGAVRGSSRKQLRSAKGGKQSGGTTGSAAAAGSVAVISPAGDDGEGVGGGGNVFTAASEAYTALASAAPPEPELDEPPLEDDLVQHTRWPEVNKLHGHANELVCLAASPDGRLIASGCKARDAKHAGVLLWDTASNRLHQTLAGHKLTPVALAFAPTYTSVAVRGADVFAFTDGGPAVPGAAPSDFLVSVSKDRLLCVFGRAAAAAPAAHGADTPTYQLLASVSAHKRIIWAVSFAPLPPPQVVSPTAADGGAAAAAAATGTGAAALGDGPGVFMFATGARDHVARIWTLGKAAVDDSGSSSMTAAAATGACGAASESSVATGATMDLEGAAGPHAAAGPGAVTLTALATLPAFDAAVTAVAFAPVCRAAATSARVWLAVGLESGAVCLWCGEAVASRQHGADAAASRGWQWAWAQVVRADAHTGHTSAVRKLAWRPLPPGVHVCRDTVGGIELQLASASDDESVRIHTVTLQLA